MTVKQSRTKARQAFPKEEHLSFLVTLVAVVSVVTIAVVSVVGVCSLWRIRGIASVSQRMEPSSPTADEMREQYKSRLLGISERLNVYLGDGTGVSHYAELKAVRNELVALLVPPDEQTHHLELVLALSRFMELIEPGADTSPAALARARRDLEGALSSLAL